MVLPTEMFSLFIPVLQNKKPVMSVAMKIVVAKTKLNIWLQGSFLAQTAVFCKHYMKIQQVS